jgi:uncharacterized DUF497 family protein
MRIAFDWDPTKATANATKHRVTFEDAMTVFNDPLALSIVDPDHSAGEQRWITTGVNSDGKMLLIVHTWEEKSVDSAYVRIISARRPSRKEARQYREGS